MNMEGHAKSQFEEERIEILERGDGKEEKGIKIIGKKFFPDAIRDGNGEVDSEGNSEFSVSIGEEKVNGHETGEERMVGEAMEPIRSPPSTPKTNRGGNQEKHKPKGYGLKKWRRIRRDLINDGSAGLDSSVILKRRHSLNGPPTSRNDMELKDEIEEEMQTRSVGSPSSVEAVEAVPLGPELVQFAIGMDSDNSEDRSSKSTAASVPKPRHEIGFGRERGRMKNQGGRGNISQQRTPQGKGWAGVGVDASKKFIGDRIRLEKENSQSSIESDLRSSNVGFTRWGSGVSNGKQSEKSLNFDGEQSDDVQSGYYKENGGVEDLSREYFDGDLLEKESNGKSEHSRRSSGEPFLESMILLQTAQEALETEIQKFADIRTEASLDDLDSQFEETEASSSTSLEAHLLELNQEIEVLQYKLEEALATTKAKETKVLELEAMIDSSQLPKMHQRLEFDLESLLKKKIEAEIELLIITRTSQSWKLLAEDQIALFEEQKSLDGDQAQTSLMLKETQNKAIKLEDQAKKLDSYCKDLLQTEKALKLQKKVCKISLYFFLQLLLLCFGMFLIKLLPPSDVVVPT